MVMRDKVESIGIEFWCSVKKRKEMKRFLNLDFLTCKMGSLIL